MAAHAGWAISDRAIIDTPELQDGAWEVDMVVRETLPEIERNRLLPAKMRELLLRQVEIMRLTAAEAIRPLSVYALQAE